ncbi:hypothetical protein ACOMHN_041042 [Nucella lapillus]
MRNEAIRSEALVRQPMPQADSLRSGALMRNEALVRQPMPQADSLRSEALVRHPVLESSGSTSFVDSFLFPDSQPSQGTTHCPAGETGIGEV